MLLRGNRSKLGDPNINWQQIALGIGKNRRKTVGFGKYDKKSREYEDELYIRELSIIDGGIGCALWDAAIILTRFIFEHGHELFSQQNVMELGAGVGLPGICAARFAKHAVLTDYLESIIENMEYNVWLNGEAQLDDMDQEEQQQETDSDSSAEKPSKFQMLQNLQKSAKCELLDWYKSAEISYDYSFDIILGSELTYTGSIETISHLIKVIEKIIDRDGVFLEVLSDDRDGVHAFMDKMVADHHYFFSIHEVPDKYMGNFCTGQQPETYKLYLMSKNPWSEKFQRFQKCLGPIFKTNVPKLKEEDIVQIQEIQAEGEISSGGIVEVLSEIVDVPITTLDNDLGNFLSKLPSNEVYAGAERKSEAETVEKDE